MAYYIPSYQLSGRPSSANNLDVQIVKQSVGILTRSDSLTESERKLQEHLEKILGKKFKTSLLIPFLKDNPNNFDIETDGKNTFISALTKLELCPDHCSGRGTCRGAPICNRLHVCKFYLLSDSCNFSKNGKNCKFGHDLTTAHNRALLQQHCLDELRLTELRDLFRSSKSRCDVTRPMLCKFYNVETGCAKDGQGRQKCPFLHLCKHYISGNCKFGKNCKRSHDLVNPQVLELLAKYGFNIRRSPKEVLADLQACGVGVADMSDSGSTSSSPRRAMPARNQMKRYNSNPNLGMNKLSIAPDIDDGGPLAQQAWSTEICIYHLRDKCGFGRNCRRHHKESMYQWQFRRKGDTEEESWSDFRKSSNFKDLEFNYSDVDTEECYVKFDKKVVFLVQFDKMIAVMKDSTTLEIRRLSTESSAVQKFQPLATQWKWYWQDQRKKWIMYGESNVTGYKAMVDCESMEQNYQENPVGQMKFATMGHEYILDFQKMVQKNLVHGTERKVRRRPTLVPPEEVETRKKQSSDTGNRKTKPTSMVIPAPLEHDPLSYIPMDWSFDRQKTPDEISDHYHLSSCLEGGQEYKKLKKLFYETMPTSASIVQIKRIENGELWMNFVSKREKMKRKKKGDINENQLFHGTNEKFIDAICKQGFDFRFSGSKTGTKYGKGSYFAKVAKVADGYTDYGGRKHMFVVRCLPGDFAPGSASFVRPPPRNPLDPFELFDSCVDNPQNPNIYVIFTFDQVYPEYVIEYQKS